MTPKHYFGVIFFAKRMAILYKKLTFALQSDN